MPEELDTPLANPSGLMGELESELGPNQNFCYVSPTFDEEQFEEIEVFYHYRKICKIIVPATHPPPCVYNNNVAYFCLMFYYR